MIQSTKIFISRKIAKNEAKTARGCHRKKYLISGVSDSIYNDGMNVLMIYTQKEIYTDQTHRRQQSKNITGWIYYRVMTKKLICMIRVAKPSASSSSFKYTCYR